MKKILIAPDSFKESLSAIEVCDIVESAFKSVFEEVECIKIPLADGGEGTLDALVYANGGKHIKVITKDPLFRDIESSFAVFSDGKTAVVEMAKTSGLELLKRSERNPLITTTYGTGQLISYALDKNIENLIVGIGGSATNDGGVGMLQALGVKFYDKSKNEIGLGAKELSKIDSIDISQLDKRLKNVNVVVACDVDNVLCGEKGASNVFSRQKGATEEMVSLLDNNLHHFALKIKEYLSKEVLDIKGGGAAGGLGVGLTAFLNGRLERGVDILSTYLKLEESIKEADLVITAEGSIDGQTAYGKTPLGVAKLCKKYQKNLIALAGKIENYEELYDYGFTAFFSILQSVCDLDTALLHARENLYKTAFNLAKLLKEKRNYENKI